jgi:hypothetical protein
VPDALPNPLATPHLTNPTPHHTTPHHRLTEEDTEYVIHAIKHVFSPGHLVIQFDCANTIAEQRLEDVSVDMDVDGAVSAGT